jgi:hypothetical protein
MQERGQEGRGHARSLGLRIAEQLQSAVSRHGRSDVVHRGRGRRELALVHGVVHGKSQLGTLCNKKLHSVNKIAFCKQQNTDKIVSHKNV